MTTVVADSGPIIHLSHVGQLELLPALYGSIIVPREVFDEVVVRGAGLPGSAELARASWAEIADHDDQSPMFRGFLKILQTGESAAMTIAIARNADMLLVDDNRARMTAKGLGLRVKGTLGLLVLAKQQGHIAFVAPHIATLRKNGVWISKAVVLRALEAAGEEDSD